MAGPMNADIAIVRMHVRVALARDTLLRWLTMAIMIASKYPSTAKKHIASDISISVGASTHPTNYELNCTICRQRTRVRAAGEGPAVDRSAWGIVRGQGSVARSQESGGTS